MTILDLVNSIRDLINSPRKQSGLLKNSAEWNRLCSSLDFIEDTQLAIEAYPQFHKVQGDGAYLIIYGILQTLLLQQDAAKHIGGALNIKVKLPRELEEIRIIRNSAAGHPMSKKENGLSRSCFIPRRSISPIGFQLMTVYSENTDIKFSDVSIPSLIEKQEKYLCEVLDQVVAEIERQEMEHRDKHKGTKLIKIFPQTSNYHFSKIKEATYSRDRFPTGTASLETIVNCLENFRKELSDRGEWGVHTEIDFRYELIEYPLNRLKAYFNSKDDMNEKEAYIFASFLLGQFELLKEIAKDIDGEYESTL